MINSFNYTPCWAVSDVPSLAQLTAPQGSAGLACSGGGSQGTHRPDPTVPPGGAEPTHSSVPMSGGGRAHPITQPVAPGTPCSHPPAVSPGSPRPRQSGGGRSRGWRLSLPSAPRGFGDGWRLQLRAPPGHGDPARAGGRRLGSGWRPRGMLPGKSPCRHPAPQRPAAHTRGTRVDTGLALPGTTPLVAIALMEMAVSIVCGKKHSVGSRQSWAEGQGSGRESWGHVGTWGSLGPC